MSRFIEREARQNTNRANKTEADAAKMLVIASENYRNVIGEIELPKDEQPIAEAQAPAAPRIEVVSAPLDKALSEYRTKPHTPELITDFQRVLWGEISRVAGVDVVVPVVLESPKEIEEKERKGKGIILVPDAYAQQAQRPLIAAAFRLVNNGYVPKHWSMQADNSVTNDLIHTGYRWIDMSIDAPHTGTNEQQARNAARKEGAEGINHSEYVIAGLQSKLVSGKYLDQDRTWIRELGSSSDGRVVRSCFDPSGYLGVVSVLSPRDRGGGLGARFSSGVKSA